MKKHSKLSLYYYAFIVIAIAFSILFTKLGFHFQNKTNHANHERITPGEVAIFFENRQQKSYLKQKITEKYQHCLELIHAEKYLPALKLLTKINRDLANNEEWLPIKNLLTQLQLDLITAGKHPQLTKLYTVKPGDSFYRLSKQHQCSLKLIKHLNQLTDLDTLHQGKKLYFLRQPKQLYLTISLTQRQVNLWHNNILLASYPLRNKKTITSLPTQSTTLLLSSKYPVLYTSNKKWGIATINAKKITNQQLLLSPADFAELTLFIYKKIAFKIKS